jgi:hypothetical protein
MERGICQVLCKSYRNCGLENKQEVANCYKKLFKKMNNVEGSPLVLSHIIEKFLPENKGCSNSEVCTYLYLFQ